MALLCKAFPFQPCSNKKYEKKTTICCHDCGEYKYCLIRCENAPSLCGKSEQGELVEVMSVYKARRVAKYNAETLELIEVYPSVKVAAIENDVMEGSLYKALCKKEGSWHGFVWRYYYE